MLKSKNIMTKFGEMSILKKEELLKNIQNLFDKMQTGRLNLDDLDNLVELTATLHERSIILRYKAIEAKIYNQTESLLDEVDDSIKNAEQDSKIEEDLKEIKEEAKEENKQEEINSDIEEDEDLPMFDFSMMQSEVEDKTISEPVNVVEPEKENQKVIEKEEPIVEVKDLPQVEYKSEETFTQTPIETPQVSGNFADKMAQDRQDTKIIDNSLGHKLKSSKLETLIGSFGMNERIQFINELFDGSAESFSDAIKTLDNMKSLDEARKKAINYGEEFEWDVDSETVGEFMQKVDRRYA